jgi:hypothetical protein
MTNHIFRTCLFFVYLKKIKYTVGGGRRDHVRMAVGFTTNQCLSPLMFESRSGRGVQHYVIKFVSDLRQLGGFLHQ